jgi:hypothetical protein
MSRRVLLILLAVFAVLGGGALFYVWHDDASWRKSDMRTGEKLLPAFVVNDVYEIQLRDAKAQLTLVRNGDRWLMKERADYPASFAEIGDLLVKLSDLKVVQTESVAASQLARLDLAQPPAPGADAKAAEGTGLSVVLKAKDGKELASLVFGKKVLKKDPLNPLPNAKDGVPAGRYVWQPSRPQTVVAIGDPMPNLEVQISRWLDRKFVKIERIKSIAGPGWKIERPEEYEPWKLVGGGNLSPQAAGSIAAVIGNLAFEDVAMDVKPADLVKPVELTAVTFDGLTYTVRAARRGDTTEGLLTVTVAGEPLAKRVPEKNENPEMAAKRDKQFEEDRKRLLDRLAYDRTLADRVFVVSAQTAAPIILRTRADFLAKPPAADAKK